MSKPININLEALRGYAALFVVFGHLLALGWMFNPNYIPTAFVVFAPSSHLFLLVFFVLSGYVITASNKGMLNGAQVWDYIKKRFLRIYPIYFMAMIITLIIAGFHYSLPYTLWNLLMLQDLVVPQFLENGPAWSLHFEVLYYLLFIPIAFFRANFITVLFLSAMIALLNFYFYPNTQTPIISGYFFGFTFWMGGACLAKYLPKSELKVPNHILLSGICFMLAIDQMVLKSGVAEVVDNLFYISFNRHLIYPAGVDGSKIVMGYHDLAFLPYCLYAVLIFSGLKFRYTKIWFAVLLLPLFYSIYLVATEQHHAHLLSFMVPVVYFVLSLVLRFVNFSLIDKIGKLVVDFGAWLGSISYGIYIIHAPLLFMLGKIAFPGGQLIAYLLKVAVLLILVLGMAYLLEKIYQPRIRKFLSGNVRPKQVPAKI